MSFGSIANKYAMFTFGDWSPYFAQILCNSKKGNRGIIKNGGSIFSNISTAYDRSQKASLYKMGIKDADTSFLSFAKNSMKSWGGEIYQGAKKGTGIFSKTFGGAKGLIAGAGKRLPLVGTALSLAFEIPNVYRAFTDKEGGAVTGTVETGKAAVKLGAFAGGAAAGAALGTLIFPGVGTVAGGIIGFVGGAIGAMGAGAVADKIVGKSFTEQQEEKAALAAAQAEGQAVTSTATQQGGTAAQTAGTQTMAFQPSVAGLPDVTPEMMQQFEQLKMNYGQYASSPFGTPQGFMA